MLLIWFISTRVQVYRVNPSGWRSQAAILDAEKPPKLRVAQTAVYKHRFNEMFTVDSNFIPGGSFDCETWMRRPSEGRRRLC